MTAPNVHQRLAAAMHEVSYVQKEKKQGMQYSTTSHDAVTAKVRPVLLKNGIVYYPVRCEHVHNGNRAEVSMTVRFVNADKPDDFFDVPTFGYGCDNQDKGPGKAMSYAVKYALLKALGLETGDDADTESVDHIREDPAAKPPKPENKPEFDAAATRDRIKAALGKCENIEGLDILWKHKATAEAFGKLHPAMQAELQKTYTERTNDLTLGLIPDDETPY